MKPALSTFAASALPRLGRLALLAAAAALTPPARALTPSEFFAQISPSIWLVRTYDKDGLPIATGSAVVIAPETLVTNCHVLRKAKTFRVTHEGTSFAGKLEMWDPARDVCQFKAAGLAAPAVEIGDSDKVSVGQPIYTLGAPRGLELTLSNGLVSALRHDGTGRLAMIQISAPISHGSSGGGLFDTDGRLIGITSSGFDDAQNLNFALPSVYIRELPARHLAALQKNADTTAAAAAPAAPAQPPSAPVIVTTTPVPPTRRPTPPPPAGAARIPFLNDARQGQYATAFSNAPYPKACAISENGHFACAWGRRTSDPTVRALKRCAELAGKPCMLYQVDDQVVYQPPVSEP